MYLWAFLLQRNRNFFENRYLTTQLRAFLEQRMCWICTLPTERVFIPSELLLLAFQ